MIRGTLTLALRFRTLLVGVAAGLIVLGVLSLRQMHTDVVPELGGGPVLEVQTEALGLSSQEVEQYVTVPMENNLLDGIMGVWDTRSDSLPGLSSVDLYFQPGTSVLHARQLVQERLTNAFALPNVSKPPVLIQPLSTTGRVMMIGLTSDRLSSLELSYLARWVVRPRLSGVPGVANVAIFGQQDRQIQVLADPARLAARHITLSQIIQTAGNAQLVSPLSYLEGSAPGTGGFLEGPNQRLEIRPVLPLGAPRDLAGVPITGAPGRQPLGSVATVIQGHQPLIGEGIVHGRDGLVLLVQKLPSASVRGVTRGVEQALGELRPALAGVQITSSVFRPADYSAEAMHNLALGAIIAAVLAVLAAAALLLSARSLCITFVSVAVSLLAATWALDALGYSLTPLVVVGLLMALTVVVDDALAATHDIVERLRARTRAGSSERIQSVIFDATAPLRGTFGYASLIVLLIVVPVFFARGATASFVHPMLLSFALAVIASLLVALTLTPALAMLLFDRGRPRGERRALTRVPAALYRRALTRAFAIPRWALLAACTAGLAGIIALPFLGQPAPPAFKDRNLLVEWDGPTGTSLPEMNRITKRVTATLQSLPGVQSVGATLGRAVTSDRVLDTNTGQLYVRLTPSADYDHTLAAVRRVVDSTPGMRADVGTYESQVMGGVSAHSPDRVDIRIFGEGYGTLRALGYRVARLMSGIHGVRHPSVELPRQEPNIEVAVDDNAALRAGVLPGDARREASTLISGLTVGNFFEQQAVFDVVVWGVPNLRGNLAAVRNLLIDRSGGDHVRLGEIARIGVRSDPIDVQHRAFSRFVDVSAQVRGADASAVKRTIRAGLGRISFPLEYHAEIVGGTPNDPTSHAAFVSYLAAALIGIFLVLQAALGSWRLAALLLLTVPAGLLGAVLVALAGGKLSSLGAAAGFLSALALSARVQLSLAAAIRSRHRRELGTLRADLVIDACSERFASALGTAVVIAAAMLPFVVMGDVPGGELAHTSAAVVLGGLASTSIVGLLLLPAAYLALGPREAPAEDLDEVAALSAPAASTTT